MRRTLITLATFLVCAAGVGFGVATLPDPGAQVAGSVAVLDTRDVPVEPVAGRPVVTAPQFAGAR